MIVCIDDDPDILDALTALLEIEDKQVLCFSKQAEAKDYILANIDSISLVLCDNRMPCGFGIDFLRSLPTEVRCCLMTGDPNDSPNGFSILRKPFSLSSLNDLLSSNEE